MVKQILRFACMTTVDVGSIDHICALALRTVRAPAAAGGAGKKKAAAKSRGNDTVEQPQDSGTREVRVSPRFVPLRHALNRRGSSDAP
jgi:hypothetical protein